MVRASTSIVVTEGTSSNSFKGSAKQLVDAGRIREDQLPGKLGRPKVSVTYYAGEQVTKRRSYLTQDEYWMWVRRDGKDTYFVVIGLSEIERARRESAEAESNAARKAAKQAELELARMPKSHADFRARCARDLKIVVDGFVDFRVRVSSVNCAGFRYDEDTIAEFEEQIARACAVLRDGRTLLNSEAQSDRIKALRAATAKTDGPLQALLERAATAVPSEP